MKNTTSIPESVRQSFEKSFKKVYDRQLWLEKYSEVINQWMLENQEPLEKDISTTTASTESTTTSEIKSTVSSVTVIESFSTVIPKQSSATNNVQDYYTISLFTVLFLIINKCILEV